MKPLISAIISTYNSERFIRGKIEDLLNQSIADEIEIIIINSGSKQNEELIIKEYLDIFPQIKYIKTETRESIYKAWNRGIKIAQGEFITNANTDDRLKHDAYELLSEYLIKNKKAALVYADQYLTQIENQKYSDAINNKIIRFPDYTHVKQLERCIIGSQPMWRASVHSEDGIFFNEEYEVSGDHEFELRVSQKHQIHHLKEVLGTFYKSPLKSNKEFENMERTKSEVNKITTEFIHQYITKFSDEKLISIQKKYKFQLLVPILIYEFIKRLDNLLFPGIYPKLFFHSIEFIYYLNIEIALQLSKTKPAKKMCKKFLRFKSSDRINKKLDKLILESE